MTLLIELIGWAATVFRSWGMLCRRAEAVKWLVTIGNLLWMVSGILTSNIPLVASNAICLVIMMVDYLRQMRRAKTERI